jgi:hypothetical protein
MREQFGRGRSWHIGIHRRLFGQSFWGGRRWHILEVGGLGSMWVVKLEMLVGLVREKNIRLGV